MCAPCKIILDGAAKAAALDGSPAEIVAAIADEAKELARDGRLPDHLLNRLSRIDARFIRSRLGGGEPISCESWIEDTLAALREEFKVEGI